MNAPSPFGRHHTTEDVGAGIDLTGIPRVHVAELEHTDRASTAQILLTVGVTQHWQDNGILANAVNPGAIATPLQRHVGGTLATPPHLQKTPEQGASTSVFAAMSPLLQDVGGRYFNDNAEASVVDVRPHHPEQLAGSVARHALDPEGADRLWALSRRLLDEA